MAGTQCVKCGWNSPANYYYYYFGCCNANGGIVFPLNLGGRVVQCSSSIGSSNLEFVFDVENMLRSTGRSNGVQNSLSHNEFNDEINVSFSI